MGDRPDDAGRRDLGRLLGVTGAAALGALAWRPSEAAADPVATPATEPGVRACASLEALRGLRSDGGAAVLVLGSRAPHDGGGGLFGWTDDDGGADPSDGGVAVRPDGVQRGHWRRLASAPIDVLWWGARRDGSADADSVRANDRAFRGALAAAASTRTARVGAPLQHSEIRAAGEVFVPRGEYVLGAVDDAVGAGLEVPPGVTLAGEGTFATVLRCASPAASLPEGWIRFRGRGAGRGGGLRDLTLAWTERSDGPVLARIDGRSEVRIERVHFFCDHTGHGAHRGASSQGVTTLAVHVSTVTGFVLADCRLQYCGVRVDGAGMSTASLERVYVNGGHHAPTAPGEGSAPGLQVPALDLACLNARVRDCVFEYVGATPRGSDDVLGAVTVRAGSGSIDGCWFEGNGGCCIDVGTETRTPSYARASFVIDACHFGANRGALGVRVGHARGGVLRSCDFGAFRYYQGGAAVLLRTSQRSFLGEGFVIADNHDAVVATDDAAVRPTTYRGLRR